jgi:hypothetical protein
MRIAIRRPAHAALAICAVSAALSASAPAALATSSLAHAQAAEQSAVSYLHTLQQPDGSIPGFGGDWSLTALAAAGTAPAGFRQSEGATDARSWYRQLVGNTSTWPEEANAPVTEYEKAALAAYAAGIDPARVSVTQNLIAQIVARYQPTAPGYYGSPSLFNGTVFALLALETKTRTGAQRVPQSLLDATVAVIRGNQHTNGGWSFAKVEGNEKALASASEPDMTGAAIAALCGAGVASTDAAIVRGREYLKSLLVAASGALSSPFGTNTDSNAWAVEGLNACGVDPQGAEFTTSAGKTPIDFLLSQQLPSGGFKYEAKNTTPNEYASQDALRAITGAGFTAPPAKAKHAPLWLYEKDFDASGATSSLITLVIDDGSSTPSACAVSIAPAAAKTKLFDVLQAAETAATPAGCLSAFTPGSGKGAISSIDGLPSPAGPGWSVSIDGGTAKPAKASTAIHLGDTIYLQLG